MTVFSSCRQWHPFLTSPAAGMCPKVALEPIEGSTFLQVNGRVWCERDKPGSDAKMRTVRISPDLTYPVHGEGWQRPRRRRRWDWFLCITECLCSTEGTGLAEGRSTQLVSSVTWSVKTQMQMITAQPWQLTQVHHPLSGTESPPFL